MKKVALSEQSLYHQVFFQFLQTVIVFFLWFNLPKLSPAGDLMAYKTFN